MAFAAGALLSGDNLAREFLFAWENSKWKLPKRNAKGLCLTGCQGFQERHAARPGHCKGKSRAYRGKIVEDCAQHFAWVLL